MFYFQNSHVDIICLHKVGLVSFAFLWPELLHKNPVSFFGTPCTSKCIDIACILPICLNNFPYKTLLFVKYSSILPSGNGTIIEDMKAVKYNTLDYIDKIVREVRKVALGLSLFLLTVLVLIDERLFP